MKQFPRITFNPEVMGGTACIRGMRVTASMVVRMVAVGHPTDKILALYPYLEAEDIRQALAYAAWRLTEYEEPLIQLEAWKQDFLSVSQWQITEEEVRIKSWPPNNQESKA